MVSTFDKEDLNAISSIFSRGFLSKIISDSYREDIENICNKTGAEINGEKNLSDLYDEIFKFLFKNYRCEYIYKNAIISKLFLGRRSLNSAVVFNELVVGNSKADLVIINDTSTVYEIKTELDSLDRLISQINSYKTIFDYNYVVTYEKNIEKIDKIIPDAVGIIILSNRYTLRTIKKAKSNKKNTISHKIFDMLKKDEYLEIIGQKYGAVPEVPNTLIYKECKELFAKLPSEEAHNYMVKVLKQRMLTQHQKNLIKQIPMSLKLFALYENLNFEQCSKLVKALSLKI
ncbi:MAG: cII phage-related protein [Clostridiaceae bacterium]|jgi:hypothetical protein|nr:cII phage-related protein [Clostridiaceae bacterium]